MLWLSGTHWARIHFSLSPCLQQATGRLLLQPSETVEQPSGSGALFVLAKTVLVYDALRFGALQCLWS